MCIIVGRGFGGRGFGGGSIIIVGGVSLPFSLSSNAPEAVLEDSTGDTGVATGDVGVATGGVLTVLDQNQYAVKMTAKTMAIPDSRRITLRLETCCDVTATDEGVDFSMLICPLGNLILGG